MPYGTYTISDLLAMTSGTIAQIGTEEEVWKIFRMSLDTHNRLMMDMVTTFCEFTTRNIIGTGGLAQGEFEELGELDTPRPQKIAAGDNLGIPLRFYGYGRQWSELFLENATPATLAGQYLDVLAADKRNIINQINRAIYLSSNYTSQDIRMPDQAILNVKRLANADGFPIPPGPNGETYDATTYTLYLARAGGALAASDLDGLISAVASHYVGTVQVAINQAQAAAVSALTGFTPALDPRIFQANTVTYAREPLVITNRGDRLIGYFNGAEIFVKPWALANYILAWNTGAPKVLSYRTRTGADNPNSALRPLYRQRGYPLTMDGWGREFGVGCTGRVSAGVLYIGATTYADPALPNAA